MAEINIEKKRSAMPWVIGILVLLLVLWALWEIFDTDTVEPAAETVTPAAALTSPVDAAVRMEPIPTPPPPTDADDSQIPVSVIVVGPAEYVARPVAGTARVAEVVSDRGFWIEQGGQRIFAVLAQAPNMEQAVDVQAGQQVRLSGVVYDSSMVDRIEGGLESQTRELIDDQPAFLLVDPRNVTVVAEAAALAG